MALELIQVRARSTNHLELTFSEPFQFLPDGWLAPGLFTVLDDRGQRRISAVVQDSDTVLLLTLPGRALARGDQLTVAYDQPDLTLGTGYLAGQDSAPFGSFAPREVTMLTTKVTLSKPMGAAFRELLLLGERSISAIGNGLDNTIIGNRGNNRIDGREGADRLIGGIGNDIYFIDHIDDEVIELSDEGLDSIVSKVSYVLPENVERLTLKGWEPLDATGNALNNVLIGNHGANMLDGGPGDDLLVGGKGSDLYRVNSSGDRIVERGLLADYDIVESSVTWVLGSKLDELRLVGEDAIHGLGNERNNVLVGNDASNVLDGGRGGTDRLTGMAGADIFRFSFKPLKFSDFYADRITDFNPTEGDKIQLSRSAFRIAANAGVTVTVVAGDDETEVALQTAVMFVYDVSQGELHWNQNGAFRGVGSGGILAVLETRPTLSPSDIELY